MNNHLRPLLLRIPEFCQLTGIGKSKAYTLIKEKKLPAVAVGGTLRIPYAAVEQLVDEAMRGQDRDA